MSLISGNVWTRLENERVSGESLWARRALPDITDRVLAALDRDERRHLLILLNDDDDPVADSQSRGLLVATRELSGRGHPGGTYIDVTCIDGSGYSAFDLIGGEIAERIALGEERASECVKRVLSKWRRFWGQAPKNLLSRDQQVGLFSELWFLAFWLVPKRGASSVHSWRGPYGSRHDFEWQQRSVEVKGTTSTRGPIHHINGIAQLDPPENGDLLMFSMRIREEAGASNSLPNMVEVCRLLFADDAPSLGTFESALEAAGYSALHQDEYGKTHWRVVEEQLFAVKDDFPKLCVTSFAGEIPSGVEQIGYDINLSAFRHLCVAMRINDAFDL
jgi:hypothetical protein